FCRVYQSSNSRTDFQESRIIRLAFMVSMLARSRYFHATSKPNRCDPYATLQDFYIRVTLMGALICPLWRARTKSGASARPSVAVTPHEQLRKDGTWCQVEHCKCARCSGGDIRTLIDGRLGVTAERLCRSRALPPIGPLL